MCTNYKRMYTTDDAIKCVMWRVIFCQLTLHSLPPPLHSLPPLLPSLCQMPPVATKHNDDITARGKDEQKGRRVYKVSRQCFYFYFFNYWLNHNETTGEGEYRTCGPNTPPPTELTTTTTTSEQNGRRAYKVRHQSFLFLFLTNKTLQYQDMPTR